MYAFWGLLSSTWIKNQVFIAKFGQKVLPIFMESPQLTHQSTFFFLILAIKEWCLFVEMKVLSTMFLLCEKIYHTFGMAKPLNLSLLLKRRSLNKVYSKVSNFDKNVFCSESFWLRTMTFYNMCSPIELDSSSKNEKSEQSVFKGFKFW